MFIYAPELDRYVDQRRQKVIDNNYESIERIRALAGVFNDKPLVKELTLNIVDSLERCFKEILSKPDSTLSFISNLRFLFETCITSRILISEDSFKYKLRFSIFKHQLEKSQSLSQYSSIDKKRLDRLASKEKDLQQNSLNLEALQKENSHIDGLYDDLDKEISIFLDMAEYNGAELHKTYIESFLSQHKKREKKIAEEWAEVKKMLLGSEEANRIFDFKRQESRVEKELKDSRTWKKKATDAGLSEMYDFIYDYTSSLLHSTSYSLLVPNKLEEAEESMIIGLATRITNDALSNLCKFADIPNMKVITV